MGFKRCSGGKSYEQVKKEFIKDLSDTFSGFVLGEDRIDGYPEHLLTVFIRFDLQCAPVLDFELNEVDFYRFEMLKFSKEEWMSIYGLFNEVFNLNHKLNPFIYLFFYDLIHLGPFAADIASLDMSDELFDLMGAEMKELYHLWDKYSISQDSGTCNELAEASKAATIPAFAVISIADWIDERVGEDKKDFADSICDLYITAMEKILKKPELTGKDRKSLAFICSKVDNPNFTENQINRIYSVMGRHEINKIKKSFRRRRRIPNPRFRC